MHADHIHDFHTLVDRYGKTLVLQLVQAVERHGHMEMGIAVSQVALLLRPYTLGEIERVIREYQRPPAIGSKGRRP